MKDDEISYREFKYAKFFVLVPTFITGVLSLVSILNVLLNLNFQSAVMSDVIQNNTALPFLVCTMSTFFLWRKPRYKWMFFAGKALAVIALALGVFHLTTTEQIFSRNLGTAPFIFMLLGFALLVNSYNRILNKIATFTNALVFFISLMGLIGYIFRAGSLYQIENSLWLAEHTALSGFMISFAGFFIYPLSKYVAMLQSQGAAGSFARRISVASLILPVLFGRIGVFFYYSGVDNSTAYASVALSCFITLIMITWKSATAFEIVDRDRIDSENEKLKSTAQIDSLLSSSPFGIAFFSTQGDLIRANQIFRKYFQIGTNQNNIHQLENFKTSIGFEATRSMTDFIKGTGQGKSVDLSLEVERHKHFISINLFPVETRFNDFLGLGVSFLDITHLKEIENELILARDSAEVSNQSKSFFLANMSHEIRTPIGIIMGFVDILNSTSLSEDEKKKNMAIIKRNCRQLLNIIDDILDISKVEAGQIKIRKEFINTLELLQDLKSILLLKIEDKKIDIQIRFSSRVPSVFFSDSTRLRQIILNICGNAIKFTKEGQITVDCFFKDNQIYFRVIDTGLGIEESQLGKLFKPFSQVDSSATREFGGTGLGLALSQQLAKALGGDLILEKSALHKGSTFLISVEPGHIEESDLISASFEKDTIQNKNLDAMVIPESLKMKTILIVDDSPDNRLLISFMLKKMGIAVEMAVDGRDALKKISVGHFDLVLMDLQMPNMGGYEAVMHLRKEGFEKPIVALTAHAMKDEKEKCLANGFTGYLTKPIDRALLISTLATATN